MRRVSPVTAQPASPGRKAMAYAEEVLGVHSEYEKAVTARNSLDACLTSLSEARDKRRTLEAKVADREMDISADERGHHPDMSAAAMERHLKVAFAKDEQLSILRTELLGVNGDIDGLECDKTMHEIDIKIAVARLGELGGYFHYLAAVKEAQTAEKLATPEKPEKTGDPWS